MELKIKNRDFKYLTSLILSGLFLILVITNPINVEASQNNSAIDFRGVTYELQYLDSTVNESFFSEEQIRTDLELLQNLNVNQIRTMGTKYGQDLIPQIAGEYGISCATGAWISWNATDSYLEIDRAVNVSDNSEFIVVGSNVYSRGELSSDQLSDYIEYAKENTNVSVTTEASWEFWLEHFSIGLLCDIIFVDINPLIELSDLSNIGGFLQSTLSSIQSLYLDKEIIFSVGFPSANHTLATEENQEVVYQNLLSKLTESDIKCYLFEAFDVPNRQYYTHAGNAGPNWGLFDVSRNPKPILSIVNENFGGNIDIDSKNVPGFLYIIPISMVTLVPFIIRKQHKSKKN